MKTERYTIGPFHFTFRGGRVWWRYSTKHFGNRITASGSTSHSLGEQLRAFFDQNPGAWSAQGLENFVNYFIADIPEANVWAKHYSRVEAQRKWNQSIAVSA